MFAFPKQPIGSNKLDEREGKSSRILTICRSFMHLEVTFKYNQKVGMLFMRVCKETFPLSYFYAKF